MSRSDAHRLADMVMAIDEIAAIVERGRPAFDDDVVLRRAVERCLEIIGEAAKSVSPVVTEAHPEIPWLVTVASRWCATLQCSTQLGRLHRELHLCK